MAKLIAFYSRADENYFGGQYRYVKVGNTEKVAKMISDLTGADMFKIEQKVPYSANYKECVAQSVKDLKSKARPELVSLPNLDDYDEIYLGYPNYCGTMPMAVYTFLEAFDFTGKTIHPFCTHEGSGLSNTVNDIKNTAKGATVTNGLPLFGSDVDKAEGKEPVSLTPGKVIVIPAEVKHWHGAKKDSWFSHIATEMPGEECSNEWCEPVTDEEYNKLG